MVTPHMRKNRKYRQSFSMALDLALARICQLPSAFGRALWSAVPLAMAELAHLGSWLASHARWRGAKYRRVPFAVAAVTLKGPTCLALVACALALALSKGIQITT